METIQEAARASGAARPLDRLDDGTDVDPVSYAVYYVKGKARNPLYLGTVWTLVGRTRGRVTAPARFLRKAEFFAALQRRQSYDPGGYFYMGRCSGLPEECLSERASISRLLRETERVFSLVEASVILAFNDQHAGWRGVARNRKHSPLQLSAGFDLAQFVRRHMFFRDPKGYADNYYFTDLDLGWFVIFCHHGCWHVHGPRQLLSRLTHD